MAETRILIDLVGFGRLIINSNKIGYEKAWKLPKRTVVSDCS